MTANWNVVYNPTQTPVYIGDVAEPDADDVVQPLDWGVVDTEPANIQQMLTDYTLVIPDNIYSTDPANLSQDARDALDRRARILGYTPPLTPPDVPDYPYGLTVHDLLTVVGDLVVTGNTDIAGLTGFGYKHTQSVAGSVWTIAHGLGYNPAGIIVLDDDGNTLSGFDVQYLVDGATLRLSFGRAFSGFAYVS